MIIKDEAIKAKILALIGDDYARKIVLATIHQAKTATELSRELDLPLSSTYRKIHELEEAGLIAIERIALTNEGKKYELYRSTVTQFDLKLRPNNIELTIVPNEDVVDKFVRLLSYIRERPQSKEQPTSAPQTESQE